MWQCKECAVSVSSRCELLHHYKSKHRHFDQVNAEFKRITTILLQSKFFSRLDLHSEKLMRMFEKRGGEQGRKIKSIMDALTKADDNVDFGRECILKALCLYLSEDPGKLLKEYKDMEDESTRQAVEETVMGIFVVREGTDASDHPEDVAITVEGIEVLADLGSVALGFAMLFELTYALDMSYPLELKYTFEVIQKVIMELDGTKLSNKAQAVKCKLHE